MENKKGEKKLIVAIFMALAMIVGGFFSFSLSSQRQFVPIAQAEEDDGEDDDKDEDEDEKDEDNEKDEDEDKEDEDEDADEDEDEDERPRVNRTGVAAQSSEDDEDDDEGEESDEDGDEEKTVTETIINADGTKTIRITKTEDGEQEIKEMTYDQSGNLIIKKEMETEGNKTETEVKTYDIYGNKLSEYKIKTIDGQVVDFDEDENEDDDEFDENESDDDGEIDDDEAGARFDVKNGVIIATQNVVGGAATTQVRIRSNGDAFQVTSNGYATSADYPMTVGKGSGKIYIKTPQGKMEIKIRPDEVQIKAMGDGSISIVENSELRYLDGKLQYVLTGSKQQKFIGIFPVDLKIKVRYSAEDGSYVSGNEPFFDMLLDWFSF